MIILHDSPSADLSHIQALADIDEGFALFDYVRIRERGSGSQITGTRSTDDSSGIGPSSSPATLPLGLDADTSELSGDAATPTDIPATSQMGTGIDKLWIAQIVQPNLNISTVGGRLDPTYLLACA